jgi:hypothetical protein
MKEQLTQYLEMEYRLAQVGLANSLDKPTTVVQSAIQRCLGAAQIVQGMGITYEEAAMLFEAYKDKLTELLDR